MNIKSRTITIILALLMISPFCFGQIAKNNIVLGQTISIESKILDETRDIWVCTPDGYKLGNENFPVLYVLDGETNFFIASAVANFLAQNQKIPRMIVVGIPNVARNRDFSPIPSKQLQNSGGAKNFVNFLEEELMVYINSVYRTYDLNILFGHSLCGMFSVYTLFSNPELFDAHISASPYLMYEDDYVIKKVNEVLSDKSNFINQLFVSIGNEPAYFNSLDQLKSLLADNKSDLNWTFKKYEDEDHGSIPFRTISDGLEFIFSDWQLTNDIVMKGVDAIKDHFLNQSQKYGYTSKITEGALNTIGYQLLQVDEIDKAIEIFEYNTELYPNSANVYDSLGDGLDAKGLKKEALQNYQKAVSIGEKMNDVNLQAFKNNVERLKSL